MQTQFYFLSPVEVVKVTSQNLDEVAKWCGGTVNETKGRRGKKDPEKYVWVPTPEGNKLSWAFPGMFITKRLVRTLKSEWKITYSVFRKDYFEKNYFGSPEDAVKKTWEAEREERNRPKPQKPKRGSVEVVTHMSDAMSKALEESRRRVKELEAKLAGALDIPVEALQSDVEPPTVNVVTLQPVDPNIQAEAGVDPNIQAEAGVDPNIQAEAGQLVENIRAEEPPAEHEDLSHQHPDEVDDAITALLFNSP